jgi:hypothetical protein
MGLEEPPSNPAHGGDAFVMATTSA